MTYAAFLDANLPVHAFPDDHRGARDHRLALLVAAELRSGCDTLWSEDMHHGLVVDGRLRVSNPFAAS